MDSIDIDKNGKINYTEFPASTSPRKVSLPQAALANFSSCLTRTETDRSIEDN